MKKIITCIDGSAYSNDVCQAGIWATKKLQKELLFLHAIEKNSNPEQDNLSGVIGLGARSELLNEMASLDEKKSQLALQLGKEMLANAETIAKEHGCETVEKLQRHGDIVEAICDIEDEARLIVIGRSGEAHQQNFKALGSHIEQIIRKVRTPLVIANKDFSAPSNFMLAYDGKETADLAVKTVIEGGLLHGLTCHLVTIKNSQPKLEEKFNQTKAMLEEKGFEVKASLVEGNIYDCLKQYQQDNKIEMMVMGAFARSKLAQIFLGSNTIKMIESTQLPMVILR